MNFQEKILHHIESAKDALALEPRNSNAWMRLREELHRALEAAILAEHVQPDEGVNESVIAKKVETQAEDIDAAPVMERMTEVEPRKSAPTAPLQAESPPASGPSIAETLYEQPITSLQNTMSINDRVRFAGELFSGDVPKLLKICTELETASSFDSAFENLVRHVVPPVDWENEEGASFEFLQRLRRLF